jgi:hypothetical protein
MAGGLSLRGHFYSVREGTLSKSFNMYRRTRCTVGPENTELFRLVHGGDGLHVRAAPAASTRTNDSTLLMNGFIFKPRPCAFAAIVPAMVRAVGSCLLLRNSPWLDVPVLYGEIVIDQFRPFNSGFNSKNPSLPVKVERLVQLPMSIRMVSVPNC